MNRTPSLLRLPLLLLLAFTATTLALPAAAGARAAKGPAPKLTIDERICKSGEATEDRYATVTATALLPTGADRVGLRFALQERQQKSGKKTRWVNVMDIGGTLGAWEFSESGRDGLRFTKTIDGLQEGTYYRVAVQARGLDASGRVTTATARRFVNCNQPQITPHVAFVRVLSGDDPKAAKLVPGVALDASTLVYSLRNSGRSESDSVIVTVTHATSGERFAEVTLDGLPARKTKTGFMTMPTCKGRFKLTVREQDEPVSSLRADQTVTYPCPGSAEPARRR